MRITLVQIAAKPNVTVGQREDGFCLAQCGQIQVAFPHGPRFDSEVLLPAHE
jgi:hypothetical protein